jgi:hypothetical protein
MEDRRKIFNVTVWVVDRFDTIIVIFNKKSLMVIGGHWWSLK